MIHIASEIQEYINNNDINHLKILSENLTKDTNILKNYINKNINSKNSKMNVNNTNHSNNTNNIKINITNNNIDAEDFMFKIWNIYLDLESIKAEWDTAKNDVIQLLHSDNKNYSNFLNQYYTYISNHTEIQYDNLIKYYIYRYFMKSCL